MADDNTPTVESLQAQLLASTAELTNARARITELNGESKGHRLNSDKSRTEAEKALKERDDAIAEHGRKQAEADAASAEKIKAEQTKATEATTKAQQRVIRADLKVAAKEAGAQDVNDVLTLLDMSKVKHNDDGDVTNAADLMAELKKGKPYLFGSTSTSNTTRTPPDPKTDPKKVKDMTDTEFDAAFKSKSWRK